MLFLKALTALSLYEPQMRVLEEHTFWRRIRVLFLYIYDCERERYFSFGCWWCETDVWYIRAGGMLLWQWQYVRQEFLSISDTHSKRSSRTTAHAAIMILCPISGPIIFKKTLILILVVLMCCVAYYAKLILQKIFRLKPFVFRGTEIIFPFVFCMVVDKRPRAIYAAHARFGQECISTKTSFSQNAYM